MKKGIKAISLALATAAILTSAASAADIWKHQSHHEDSHDSSTIACNTPASTTTSTGSDKTVFTAGKNGLVPASKQADPSDTATVFVDGCPSSAPKTCTPAYTVPKSIYCSDLWGATYYSRDNAKKALEEYFAENTYDMHMDEGQEKTFCSNAYFYSSDPETVYYDKKSGTLVANQSGTAHIYVFTEGGVPFFKLNVYVARDFTHHETAATLNIVPDSWRLEVGDTTGFTITASDGKTYDDIVLKIASGSDKAKIGQISGKLTAEENGAVIVHAYSKTYSSVTGDALIYIGPYTNAITDDGWNWSNNKDCITVNKWCPSTDWCGDYYSCLNGWIRSAEGILIPVIKVMDVTVNDYGETYNTSAILTGTANYINLLR